MTVKFLIIRFSSIGDIVLTTPVIRCLKQQVENAEVHFLTKKQFYPVIQANPYIDKIHLLGDTMYEVTDVLKEEGFHHIIDLHNNLRSRTVKKRVKVYNFSVNKLNWKKWLLVNFKINKMPDVHIVDRYLDTIKLFDAYIDNKGLDYFIPPEEEVNLTSLPEPFQKNYIALVVGANHFTKQMPNEKIIDICNQLDYPVMLMGGTTDVNNAKVIEKQVNKPIYNACGKYSINQSASLIKQAQVVITPDTGLMHIAAAFKKKIISVWGNTVPELGMYPYQPHPASQLFENKDLKCRPCSKIGFKKCPKGHFNCMNQIENGQILETAQKLLKED